MFRDALRVFRSAGYPAGVAVAMSNLGWAEVLAGDVGTGIEHLDVVGGVFVNDVVDPPPVVCVAMCPKPPILDSKVIKSELTMDN